MFSTLFWTDKLKCILKFKHFLNTKFENNLQKSAIHYPEKPYKTGYQSSLQNVENIRRTYTRKKIIKQCNCVKKQGLSTGPVLRRWGVRVSPQQPGRLNGRSLPFVLPLPLPLLQPATPAHRHRVESP